MKMISLDLGKNHHLHPSLADWEEVSVEVFVRKKIGED
jgi:hypothetical protein